MNEFVPTRNNYIVQCIYYGLECVEKRAIRSIILTRRVPVESKSPVCLICMKSTIIILVIIIIRLGQILLSYITNTSRTHVHARTHTRTRMREHTHTHRRRYGTG